MAKAAKKEDEKGVRTSFMVKPLLTKQMKYICLTQGGNPSQLIDKVMTEYITAWEKKNGSIPIK